LSEAKPPTDEELSRWVITGETKRQDLAQRLGRCLLEIRRIRAALTESERGHVEATAEVLKLRRLLGVLLERVEPAGPPGPPGRPWYSDQCACWFCDEVEECKPECPWLEVITQAQR
jgi:hypothetical protein